MTSKHCQGKPLQRETTANSGCVFLSVTLPYSYMVRILRVTYSGNKYKNNWFFFEMYCLWSPTLEARLVPRPEARILATYKKKQLLWYLCYGINEKENTDNSCHLLTQI